MIIPTELIGSIPRPLVLIEALRTTESEDPWLESLDDEAIRDTITRFERTGSAVITDGGQHEYHNFGTYGEAEVRRGREQGAEMIGGG